MNVPNRFWRGGLVALTALFLLGVSTPGPATAQTTAPPSTTPTTDVTGDDAPPPSLDPQDDDPPNDADQVDGATFNEHAGGGGGKNVVKLNNRVDGRMRMRGNVQFSRVRGDNVGPVNLAYARGSCTGCSTFAVALQIAVYRRGASRVVPQNAAVALNVECHHCVTVAHAYQYAIPVDDPRDVPERVNNLTRRMDQELRGIQRDADRLTPAEAEARIEAVIAEFQDLANSLMESRDERDEDSDAPPPTPTATLTTTSPSTSAEPTATPTATPPTAGGAQSSDTGQVSGTTPATDTGQGASSQPTPTASPAPSATSVP